MDFVNFLFVSNLNEVVVDDVEESNSAWEEEIISKNISKI
jgi:hypothetical protein